MSCRRGAGRGQSWVQGHTDNGQCYIKPPENQPIVSVVGLSGLLPTFISNEHYLARAGLDISFYCVHPARLFFSAWQKQGLE